MKYEGYKTSYDQYIGQLYAFVGPAVATAEKINITTYSKGDTFYEIVSVAKGTLPESGTLIEGSATDSYCIIDIDGTYYYYVKQ